MNRGTNLFSWAAVSAAILYFSIAAPAFAAESGGVWSEGEMVEYSGDYIQKVRSKFPKRVERIKTQIGETIPLDFKLKIEEEPLKTEFERALSGKLDEGKALKLFSDILKDMDKVGKAVIAAEKKAYKSWEKEPKARGEWNLTRKEMTEPGVKGSILKRMFSVR